MLNGSEAFYLAAVGKETTLEATSDWPDPSFQGAWLPVTREVGADGFAARWSVPFLGRNTPSAWIAAAQQPAPTPGPHAVAVATAAGMMERALPYPVIAAPADAVGQASFGVHLATPVDTYRMAERSAKYASLFLVLTFGTLWLFEVLAGVRLHAVQYLLVGGAMCLFYLLETSLAEHVGFGPAYVLASVGVVGLIAAYAMAVLQRAGRAAIVGGILVVLYGYLYVLLTNQDYALLAGSLGLFAALGAVMFLTRRVDWSAVGGRIAAVAGVAAER